MKAILRRTTIREIKGSFGRFFAILAIIALGVGFFSGVKITKGTMTNTMNQYWKEKNFFDLHLLSTIGFEEEDVEAFSQEEDVRYAEGVYTFDALYSGITENEMVLKTHTMPEQINGIRLISGRLPESSSECVIDSEIYVPVELGSVIRLTDDNEDDTLEAFAQREFTVVGTVDSSYYMNFERGTTSIGNGKVEGFIYVLPSAFDCEYYTDVFICFNQDYDIYTQEYEDYMENKTELWEDICGKRVDTRFETLLKDAREELEDAKEELADKQQEGETELGDAYTELIDGENRITDGRAELNKAWKTLQENETELSGQEEQLAQREQEFQQQKNNLENTIQQLSQDQQLLLQGMVQSLQQTDDAGKQALLEQWSAIPGMEPMVQLALGSLQIEEGRVALAAGRSQLEEGKSQLESGRNELIQKEQELKDAKEELEEGWQEYENAKEEFDEKIEEAETKIADAQEEIDELEEPDSYVLGRETNVGYVCFESDSDIVDAIAKVFPIFFILVAALVCMTTMNRMIEEQRTQIGVLKALGYAESAIMGKYMFYSGSAALLGCVIGYAVGTVVFPRVIWTAYDLMYQSHTLHYVFNWKLAAITLCVSLLCSIGTTWFSCHYELSETAASLMRAKAPKAGRRVFLERIPFIWKRLKFLHKVSVRNLLRYKKRFFMMVIGISGCTALVLTGFGIKDSITGFAQQQYEEIQVVDGTIGLKDAVSDSSRAVFAEKLETVAQDYLYVSESAWDIVKDGSVKNINMVIPEETTHMDSYMRLRTKKGDVIEYPGLGEAVLSNSIAEENDIEVGDEILLRNEDMQELRVKVTGLFENYVYDYIFLSKETYEEQMGEMPEFKTIYINYAEGVDQHQAAAELMQDSQVVSTAINEDTKIRLTTMMSSLNYVVLLIIISAAGLAFIVLYNLTNINITERLREIATIKVLGFFRNETASYVFRENIALTAIGIVVGLVLGVFLHRFVMAQIHVDMVSFDTRILPISYLYSVLLTFAFNFFVNGVMTGKLEKINMAESLKSVE